MNQLLIIKNLLCKHIKENTIITECYNNIQDKNKKLPYAIIQRGSKETTRDICNIKDCKIEFGVRVVAGDENQLYEAIDQISLLWNKTGAGSLYQELHENNVMTIDHRYDQTGLIDSGEIYGVLSIFVEIRQVFSDK